MTTWGHPHIGILIGKLERLREAIEKKREVDGEWTYADRKLYKALENL